MVNKQEKETEQMINAKIAEWAGRNVVPSARTGARSGNRPAEELVLVSKSEDKSKGSNRRCLRISLHPRAVSRAGWQIGDKIGFDITDQGAIVLSRSNQPTARVLGSSKSSTKRAYLRYAVVDDFYAILPSDATGVNVEIDSGIMAFELRA